MSFPEPVIDYRATSARVRFADIPAEAVRRLGVHLGSDICAADEPVRLGFSPAYAGRAGLADGRHVFLKAAAAGSPAGDAVARERLVLAALPDDAPAARLLAGTTADGWELEAVELVDGHVPGLPWTEDDAERVHRALVSLSRIRPHDLPDELVAGDFATSLGGDERIRGLATRLLAGEVVLPPWLPHTQRMPELGALALRASRLVVGDCLQHSDLRPDNLLVDHRGEAVLLDWNWLERGPGWTDLVGLLPLMAEDGIDTDDVLSRSPLVAGADPDAIDAFLAVVAVYMLADLQAPPFPGTLPALRNHQALLARAFVAFLGRRRRW